MSTYHRPPDDYEPPTHCERCGAVIAYGPVIGGRLWTHIGLADHDVVMRPEGWWDVATGAWRTGIADLALEVALHESRQRVVRSRLGESGPQEVAR